MKESEYNEIIAALRAAEETIRQLRDELKKWQTTRCQCIKTQIEETTEMCEATCVINELRRLKRDVSDVVPNQYTALGFEQRLQLCIDQLKAANEGESWHDLKLRFVPSTQP